MKPGTKLKCVNDVKNMSGQNLFESGGIYDVLFIEQDSGDVVLSHNLYSNEYSSFPREFVDENFIFENDF